MVEYNTPFCKECKRETGRVILACIAIVIVISIAIGFCIAMALATS